MRTGLVAATMGNKPFDTTHAGNNFDFVRIVAATLVLVSHHFALTGRSEPSFFGVHSLGGLAVTVFFVISGYLVTESWQRDPNLWRFTVRRVLRIWPALTAVIVLTAYGLGAWLTELPLRDYLSHRATANYLSGLWMQIHFVLPGVFEHNPYARSVNGSLWTIPIEVRCYIALAIAGTLGLLKFRIVLLFCIAIYMAWFFVRHNADTGASLNYVYELTAFFLAGSALQSTKQQWSARPVLWSIAIAVAVATAWVLSWRHTAILIGLPFVTINLATRSTPYLRHAGRWGDPSYGIYLIAFPVQQAVIQLTWPQSGFAGSLALSMLITVILAYTSWHLIEKQALKWKPMTTHSASRQTIFQNLRDWPTWAKLLPWFWPLLAGGFGLQYIYKRLDAPVLIDAAITYLPAARAFIEQGWSYFSAPQQDFSVPLSYFVAPLAYIWPALWSADPQWIRIGNMGLWIGCVWFLWRSTCILGGVRAGAFAMLLLLHPVLVRYFPTELTEPIFLFGLFGWMHALARMVVNQERSWTVIAQGAAMLTITLLSRPVLQLIAPLLAIGCLGYSAFRSVRNQTPLHPSSRTTASTLGWSLCIGLLLPVSLAISNGVFFGLWGLGTGSGTGIYLGTHPLYQGAEPAFLGFGFDVNNMVWAAEQTSTHLSIAADKSARAAALWQIQSMPINEAIGFFGRKLWWWLAHHPVEVDYYGSALRKVRFFELFATLSALCVAILIVLRRHQWLLASWGTVGSRQWTFAAVLFTLFLAMVVQLLPILYNARYSSNLLDPWLIPLTAFALAAWTAPLQFRIRFQKNEWCAQLTTQESCSLLPAIGAAVGIVALSLAGFNLAKKYDRVEVDPLHMGATSTVLEITSYERVHVQGLEPGEMHSWVVTETPAVLRVSVTAEDIARIQKADVFNALWSTEMSFKTPGPQCKFIETAYQTDDGEILQPKSRRPILLRVKGDGEFQSLYTHANQELRPRAPGSLRLVVHCPVGTQVKWERSRLLESRHAWDAASHIRH